jgi:hypothetical protein
MAGTGGGTGSGFSTYCGSSTRTSSRQTVNGTGVSRDSWPPMWNAISTRDRRARPSMNVPEYVCGFSSTGNGSFQYSLKLAGPA